MSGPSDPNGEMPVFPFPRRDGDRPVPDGVTLDHLLGAVGPDGDPPPEVQALADLLAASRAPGSGDELAGEAAAVAAFFGARRAGSGPGVTVRRPSMLSVLLSSKLAAALTAGALTLGGVAVAASTGVLPDPLQEIAHQSVGAPAADDGGDHGPGPGQAPRSDEPAGPNPAATRDRLCLAFGQAEDALAQAADSLEAVSDRFDIAAAGAGLAEAANRTGEKAEELCSDATATPPGDHQAARDRVCDALFRARAALRNAAVRLEGAADRLENALRHLDMKAAKTLRTAALRLTEASGRINAKIEELCPGATPPPVDRVPDIPPLPELPDLPERPDLPIPDPLPVPTSLPIPDPFPSLPTSPPPGR